MLKYVLKSSFLLPPNSRIIGRHSTHISMGKTQYQISKIIRKFSSSEDIYSNLTYTETHEWLSQSKENTKIGLSKNAIEQLGDLIYVEPNHEKGDIVYQNDELVVIESIKAVDSIKAPYDCIIIENNENINEVIDSINENPECVDNSWIIKIDEFKS